MARGISPSIEMISSPSVSKVSNLEEGKQFAQEEDDPKNPKNITRKVAAEFIGTFVLVLIGAGSAFVNQRVDITLVGGALASGAAVGVMVYAIGHISGCHINPAVTFGAAVVRQLPWKQVPLYVLSQVLGSLVASLTLRWLFDGDAAAVMQTHPSPNTSDLNAIACEIILTFILMFVISGAACDNTAVNELAGVAIGLTITFNAIIGGTISGASMNPARSIGPAIATQNFRDLWIYILAPPIGAAAGSTLYSYLRLPRTES